MHPSCTYSDDANLGVRNRLTSLDSMKNSEKYEALLRKHQSQRKHTYKCNESQRSHSRKSMSMEVPRNLDNGESNREIHHHHGDSHKSMTQCKQYEKDKKLEQINVSENSFQRNRCKQWKPMKSHAGNTNPK